MKVALGLMVAALGVGVTLGMVGCSGNDPGTTVAVIGRDASTSDANVANAAPDGPGLGSTGGPRGPGDDGGASDGVSTIAPATFTAIYASIFSVSCAGADCHNPGSRSGVSFATQTRAYHSIKSQVTPGDPSRSKLYTLVSSGRMPPSGPKLSSDQVAAIASWIQDGAQDD
jgi:hypothetical protein